MSALNDILNAVQTQVASLTLTAPGASSPLPVVIRKLPRAEEGLDQSGQINICKSERPEKVRWLAFPSTDQPQGTIRVDYEIIVAVIMPGNADYVSNIDTYAGWREQIRGLFQKPPLTGASTVIDLNSEPDVFLPKSQLLNNYDYQVVGIRVTSIEAGNA